jgi:hypothetical protein
VFNGVVMQAARMVAPIVAAFVTIRGNWDDVTAAMLATATNVWAGIQNVISGGVTTVLGILRGLTAFLAGDWSGAWESAKRAIEFVGDAARVLASGPLASLAVGLSGAAGMARSLASGIDATIGAASRALGPLQALADKAKSVGDAIRSLPLIPGSPTLLEQGINQTTESVERFTASIERMKQEWSDARKFFEATNFQQAYPGQGNWSPSSSGGGGGGGGGGAQDDANRIHAGSSQPTYPPGYIEAIQRSMADQAAGGWGGGVPAGGGLDALRMRASVGQGPPPVKLDGPVQLSSTDMQTLVTGIGNELRNNPPVVQMDGQTVTNIVLGHMGNRLAGTV